MKRTLSFMVMALALLLTQCRKPEVKFPSPVAPEGTTVSMTVTAGPGSKTDINGTTGAITWSANDKIYVGYDGKYVGCLEIENGVGTPTGTFSGEVTLPTGTENGVKTFHFFYLGSNPPEVPSSAQSVEVSFAEQTGLRDNLGSCHIGYGTAQGTVVGSEVTGINVTLVSKVALARFSFTKNDAPYEGALTLGGTNIYNEMTVNFNGSFNHGETPGSISLTGSHSERYVMLVPPADVAAETLNFDGGAGTTILENGIEANKFYGKNEAIPVTINAYVDFGLPSGLLWATCNLGATSPGDYGDYYQWGGVTSVTSTTIDVGWTNCPGNGGSGSYNATFFNTWKAANLTGGVLNPGVDAATANWGGGWRMPTEADFTELKDNTTRSWTIENSVNGWKCANKSDPTKYIFLPAAGYRFGTRLYEAGSVGDYWSSSLHSSQLYNGRDLYLTDSYFGLGTDMRCSGGTVRPVCEPQN